MSTALAPRAGSSLVLSACSPAGGPGHRGTRRKARVTAPVGPCWRPRWYCPMCERVTERADEDVAWL